MIFFEQLMKVAALEVIPTDAIYEYFSDTLGRPRDLSFEQVGLEHHLVMNNFGTLGLIFSILPLFMVIQIMTNSCKKVRCCKKLSKFISRRLYYNYPIRIVIESYVIALICCFINLNDLEFS